MVNKIRSLQGVYFVLPITKNECQAIRQKIPSAYIVCINAHKKSRAKKYAVEETAKVMALLNSIRDKGESID